MSAPETVQYFQFDSDGNMFIFAPGSGCSGPTKLAKPGDELIFSSTYQPHEWTSETSVKEEAAMEDREGALSSTCPGDVTAPIVRPFNAPLHGEDLVQLAHKSFSEDTMRKVRWATKMYRDWRNYRHSQGLEQIECDLDDKATVSVASLKFALCRFITEVKKVNGEDFPGKTLCDIVICLQFNLECQGFAFRLINDDAFQELKYTLDNVMKQRTAQGIGISVRKAQVLSATDEDFLWSMGYLGTAFPDQLLNTVVFAIGKGFALRAGKKHRALRAIPFNSQLTFMRDPDGEIYLRYTEDIGLKTNKGGLKHRRVEPKCVDLYAASNIERCPLRAILKYMSLLPKARTCTAFYLQPRKKFFGKSWYVNRPAGINRLRNVVKEMCHEAGLPGFYTNHSLRSTAATKMYQNNIDEQLIQEITGHRSLAVRSYKRTSDKQRKMASNCLFTAWMSGLQRWDHHPLPVPSMELLNQTLIFYCSLFLLYLVCYCIYCSLYGWPTRSIVTLYSCLFCIINYSWQIIHSKAQWKASQALFKWPNLTELSLLTSHQKNGNEIQHRKYQTKPLRNYWKAPIIDFNFNSRKETLRLLHNQLIDSEPLQCVIDVNTCSCY